MMIFLNCKFDIKTLLSSFFTSNCNITYLFKQYKYTANFKDQKFAQVEVFGLWIDAFDHCCKTRLQAIELTVASYSFIILPLHLLLPSIIIV
jgi:hypothetical protein